MKMIESSENKTIKELLKLKKGTKRKQGNIFLIDGEREIRVALQEKVNIIEIFYSPEIIQRKAKKLSDSFLKINTTALSERVFNKIAYKQNPDGFIAIAEKYQRNLEEIKFKKPALVIILEAIEKPGNLGAIIRTASAAQVDLILITESKIDIFNPNVIRASEGLIFSIPIINTNNKAAYNWLKLNNINSFAASTQAKTDYLGADFTKNTALIFGSEDQGLSDFWLKKAEKNLKIKMEKNIDSLNLSVSTAIILFEALRQRRKKS